MRSISRVHARIVDSKHLLLLKGLLMLALIVSAFLAAWHYGLLERVWLEDRTGLSVAITLIFVLASGHGWLHVVRLSRILNELSSVERYIRLNGHMAYRRTIEAAARARERARVGRRTEGPITRHAINLCNKARLGATHPINQRLLLEAFEADLRKGHNFGWFVSDLLLSLGLLGTVIGFIVMLSPIGSLDGNDESAVRAALSAMSGGMAVALHTTLAGLIGGMLLKVQGLLLDSGVDEVVRRTTRFTEIYVLPAIEREPVHAPA